MEEDTIRMSSKTIGKYTIDQIRGHFPILTQKVNGKPLVYFDNAATTQKPQAVINALNEYYSTYNSNIHRGIHTLAEKATENFERARQSVQQYINAGSKKEVIFTYGTTDGINLVSQAFGKKFLNKGDEILISAMEHHSNIVPWQLICEETGAELKIIPINDKGEFLFEEFQKLLNPKTRLISVVHVSNSLGTIIPVREVIEEGHRWGAKVLIDGAQAAAHFNIDVQDLDCDFYVFSSHKMFGPTGVGILYGKEELLYEMLPFRGGGEMISEVTFEKTIYNDLPFKYEAGTPNIADVIGFQSAIEFIEKYPKKDILEYEIDLLSYATEKLKEIEGLRIIGEAKDKFGVISFLIDGIHPFDVGMMLDAGGIAVRTGHHCCQPLMNRLNIEGTVRISFSIYNTYEEIDTTVNSLKKIVKIKRK